MIRLFAPAASLLTTACLLMGCGSLRNEVSPDRLNRSAAKLVVNGFLSPQDTVLAVKLTRSTPVLGTDSTTSAPGYPVADATVTVSDGSQSVSLAYDPALAYYRADVGLLPIVGGRQYTLMVQTTDGQRYVSTCTIPQPVALTGVQFDSLTQSDFGYQLRRYYVRARWQDPAGQDNYYQITGAFRYVTACTNCTTVAGYVEREQFNNLSFDASDNRGLLTDQGTEGGPMISGRAYLTNGGYGIGSRAFLDSYKRAAVELNLLNVEQTYYQYRDAINRQAQVGGNPFAEPVIIPSNVSNGALGCFAGYNRSSLTIKLK